MDLNDLTLDRTTQAGTWTMRFDALLPTGNTLMRMHHHLYQRLMKEWFFRIRAHPEFMAISRPKGKRYLLIIRHTPNKVDEENLVFCAKPLRDVLRPSKHSSGVYKTGPKKGQPWQRSQMGHGLIIDDDPDHCGLTVIARRIQGGRKGFTTLVLSDHPINPDDF